MVKNVEDLIPEPKNKFLKVKCGGCGNEQIIFSAPSRKVKCLVCNEALAESTSHRARVKGKIVEEF